MSPSPNALLSPAVYIVGAGPGDPELLTVKAKKILDRADVIIFADSLVPKQTLQDVRSDAELIRTGNKTLEEILPLMITRVRENCSVVRLHSGDLTLYSAIHEQIQALAEADIPFELVPGIGAFQETIILTRISGRASTMPESEELASLAAHQASLGLYLAARHVEDAQEKLLQHYPPDTPVAVCFRLGWSDEKIWVVPLDKMAAISQKEKLLRTTLYLISPALRAVEGKIGKARSRLYHPEHSHLFRPP
ncbi:MAG: precorrin-4 C(11)-methyltransferase [Cyanobacteria bacterium SW_7_48_12]|nr:MAG: precorrin-4 C(11)-methyltransferase [Cyanobacteria bacterium SW_7_48_12]